MDESGEECRKKEKSGTQGGKIDEEAADQRGFVFGGGDGAVCMQRRRHGERLQPIRRRPFGTQHLGARSIRRERSEAEIPGIFGQVQ